MALDAKIVELLGIAYASSCQIRRKAAAMLVAIIQNDHGEMRLQMAEREDSGVADELRALARDQGVDDLLEPEASRKG